MRTSVFIFKKTTTDTWGINDEIIFRSNSSEYLPDLLESFERFLKGCGYSVEGKHLEMVENEEYPVNSFSLNVDEEIEVIKHTDDDGEAG